jgi:SAM-dependent methyltransferase
MTTSTHDSRDLVALRRHYEIERELADRIRRAAPEARPALYRTVYDELFVRVQDHPQNIWKASPEQQSARTAEQIRLLNSFLGPETVYLEVGAGDCHLAQTIAGRVKHSYGVDVSNLIAGGARRPSNFDLLIADGARIPVADDRATVAFSNMLVEHLHPDDFARHLCEVVRVLAPGGVYICRTPHRFVGPTDISAHFDEKPTGFHLKEYSFRELSESFRVAGFARVRACARVTGLSFTCPSWTLRMAESALELLPYRLRKRVCRSLPFRPLFGTVTILGWTDHRRIEG